METIFDWSVILSIVGILVVVTNIITQVLKSSPGTSCPPTSWRCSSPWP